MKDEAAFKKHFKASVRAQGGYSISLVGPMLPGIPDLYVAMPGFAPVLLEAKWMKEVPDKFNRQLKFTPLQIHTINSCNKVYPGIAWGLAGGTYKKATFARLVNVDQNVVHHTFHNESTSWIAKKAEFFDVRRMFELYVPKMQIIYHIKPLTGESNSVSISSDLTQAGNNELAIPTH